MLLGRSQLPKISHLCLVNGHGIWLKAYALGEYRPGLRTAWRRKGMTDTQVVILRKLRIHFTYFAVCLWAGPALGWMWERGPAGRRAHERTTHGPLPGPTPHLSLALQIRLLPWGALVSSGGCQEANPTSPTRPVTKEEAPETQPPWLPAPRTLPRLRRPIL